MLLAEEIIAVSVAPVALAWGLAIIVCMSVYVNQLTKHRQPPVENPNKKNISKITSRGTWALVVTILFFILTVCFLVAFLSTRGKVKSVNPNWATGFSAIIFAGTLAIGLYGYYMFDDVSKQLTASQNAQTEAKTKHLQKALLGVGIASGILTIPVIALSTVGALEVTR